MQRYGGRFLGRCVLQLVIRYHHEIVPIHHIAADDLLGRHLLARGFRDGLIANSGMVLLMQQVRADALGFSSGVQTDGNSTSPKAIDPFQIALMSKQKPKS